jgi:hypothetical protein
LKQETLPLVGEVIHEEEVLERLYKLTDDELRKEAEFYNYSLKQNKELD